MTLFDSIKYPISCSMTWDYIRDLLPGHFQFVWDDIYFDYDWPIKEYESGDAWEIRTTYQYNECVQRMKEHIQNFEE